jgi:hypothetical protein
VIGKVSPIRRTSRFPPRRRLAMLLRMPQRFFALDDLRSYGLTPGDVRGQQRSVHETWALPDLVAKMLRSLLERTGFDLALPIHVHENGDARGFVLTQ